MYFIFFNVTMAKPEKENKKGISEIEASANVLKKTFLAADIKGTVSDDKGEKLPGVNVIIKGTSRGTSTNANGEFSLSNVNNNDVLVLTYVGYESQEIQINNKTDFSIVLKTDAKALDEVVVVGYGTQKRSNITGSISTIKAADLSKVQSPSFDNALQGKSPGVYVSSNGGQPGGGRTNYAGKKLGGNNGGTGLNGESRNRTHAPQGGWQPAIGPRDGSREGRSEGGRDARPRSDNAAAGDRRPTADRAFAARSENRRDPGAPARNYGPKKGGNGNYKGTVKRAG